MAKIAVTPGQKVIVSGKEYNIYNAIVNAGVPYVKVKSRGRAHILVDKCVLEAIRSWQAASCFAGMHLTAYLKKVFS